MSRQRSPTRGYLPGVRPSVPTGMRESGRDGTQSVHGEGRRSFGKYTVKLSGKLETISVTPVKTGRSHLCPRRRFQLSPSSYFLGLFFPRRGNNSACYQYLTLYSAKHGSCWIKELIESPSGVGHRLMHRSFPGIGRYGS